MTLFPLLERVHGHLAVLGLAVLLHPVVTLRTRRGSGRWTQLSADLGALMLALPAALGIAIYPTYRASVKPDLLLHAPNVAAAFETKEHLGAMAVALAVSGALVLRHPPSREAAWSLLLAAWLCGLGAGLIGIGVASFSPAGS